MTAGGELKAFGLAVRKARTAKGWTLEMLAHEALGNQERKSFVSVVENGRRKLSALTIQKFARVLDLPEAIVDATLGMAPNNTADEAAVERNAEALMREVEALRRELKLSEALVLALAHEFAEGGATDRDAAITGLRRTLEVARELQIKGESGSNFGLEVDAVFKRLAELTERGELGQASDEANRALAAWEEEQEEVKAKGLALLDAGIAQDYLRRDAEAVARKLVRKSELDRAEGANVFEALSSVWNEWHDRGRDKGLNLDLEVSISVANLMVQYAESEKERGAQLIYVGVALYTLGERESGTLQLRKAVEAVSQALKEWTREHAPLEWAMTQNNLGNALSALGARERDTVRLEEAVYAYSQALREYTRERAPLNWATTQNNLGNVLQILGSRETEAVRLEQAVEAYSQALKEWTRESVPLDWAATQNNLGLALATLGKREIGTTHLEQALEAFHLALEEWTCERVPLDWAMARFNIALVFETLFAKTKERNQLDQAIEAVDEALQVYREAQADYYLDSATRLRERLLKLRDDG